MLIDPQILAFAGLAALLTLSPGADTMLVMRSVISRGPIAGILTTAGICSGLFVHASLSAAGLSLILLKSAIAFEILKTAGACYLFYLGFQSIRQLFKKGPGAADSPRSSLVKNGKKSARRAFMEGMLNNILNPKPAVFYLALLPQFIGPADPVFLKSLLLATIHFAMSIIYLSAVSLFFGKMRSFLASPRAQRWLEASSGAILIGLGIRLAMEKR
ncbi:MAG: LysE family translocator [Desulfobacterales bacterium]|nr:LysE family translocator [Desulfobacterales bacterium]